MKKITALFVLLLSLVALSAQKMNLKKPFVSSNKAANNLYKPSPPRIHPYTHLLKQNISSEIKRSGADSDRLLVILVDFVAEDIDDPNTTGNGKFNLLPDPTYLYSIGAPPHNQEYFNANLKAMEYYYQAVSAQSYNLEYDIYPKDKPAYTLPQKMGYYNPPGASSELFVSRMEEYFKSSFETADADDPEIDFSGYGHFMIIHAGSDWQHDVLGDTPSDIPSFFIRVGAGKEAVVDGGTFLIGHACNVPSTISQDFDIIETDNGNIHTGYGALNAVIAHEFGHSIGFVDLYDVYSYRPMVGMFDIMDSGGSGVLVDQLPGGNLVYVEGALPGLPGPFSRNLAFGDFYAQKGLLKETPDFDLFANLPIKAISSRQSDTNVVPHTYKIPLNPKEYILVENRNVDPDGDGGTAVFGDLDGRVVLYPTAFDDPTNLPTYEYDYLLPSFIETDGSAVGGGLLVWHINEEIIYEEGNSYSDGSWVSNFDSNTVNTDLLRRGVKVIEADGLSDLGSDYSMYWTGTPYEYFHARKPVLDQNGQFVQWSQEPWKPELNSTTKPALLDSNNLAGLYHLKQISHPSANMSFSVASAFFEDRDMFNFASPSLIVTEVINSGFNDYDLPAIHLGQIDLLSNVGGDWQNLMGTFYNPMTHFDFPPVKTDNNQDGIYELATVKDWRLQFMDFANVDVTTHQISFPAALSVNPVSIGNSLFAYQPSAVFQNELYKISNYQIESFGLPNQADILKLAGWGNKLVALGTNQLGVYDTGSFLHAKRYQLPEAFGDIDPLIFTGSDPSMVMIFVMANSGNLYRIYNETPELIFANHSSAKPGQLGITTLGDISPVVFFGLGSQLYALKSDGTVLSGFPYQTAHNIATGNYPLSLRLSEMELMFYPLTDYGYIAIDSHGKHSVDKSLSYPLSNKADFLFYHPGQEKLYWYYPDSEGKLFIYSLSGLDTNPILFAGYRNGGSGQVIGAFSDETPSPGLNAYIFPNPVKKEFFKVRLENYSGDTNLKIFDISGVAVRNEQIPESLNNPRDYEIDARGLSSGVYILNLENNGKHKRIKFAVEY